MLLHNVYGTTTERLLRDVGVFPGMLCADIGCGIGTVSCWLAREAGPTGMITSVDVSADQLAIVRKHAAELLLHNVETHEASAYETGLPDDTFDLVYCRFLLCHLQRPKAALREFVRVLKPGGALVCEDIDVLSTYAEPDTDGAYAAFREVISRMMVRKGVDSQFGRRLAHAFLEAGILNVQAAVHQPIHLDGEEKRFWEYTFQEAIPGVAECGATTEEAAAEILRGMRAANLDRTVLVGSAAKWQVWGRKGEQTDGSS